MFGPQDSLRHEKFASDLGLGHLFKPSRPQSREQLESGPADF